MNLRRRRLIPCALLPSVLLATFAVAATRADFAWQFPLQTGDVDGLLALTLVPEVYERAAREDLDDVVAFNAAGEQVPLGPIAHPQQRARMLQPEAVRVPMFAVPRGDAATTAGDAASAEAIALHIRRNDDGRLTRLDATVTPAAVGATPHDLLLDMSAFERPITGLVLQIDDVQVQSDGAALDARVAVDGSEDLGHWRTLADGLALVSLREGGFRLERNRLELPRTKFEYLRIRRTDAAAGLPVYAVAAVPAPIEAGLALPPMQQLVLSGTAAQPLGRERAEQLAGVYDYAADGAFPAARIEVLLADRNAIADVVVSSRGNEDSPWRERVRFTAFRLAGGASGDEVGNEAVHLGAVRDRYWRVHTTPPQPRAPELHIGWVPDRFLLLTQGEAPYTLAVGSARATRGSYPVQAALASLQAQRGESWQPPQAVLGAGVALAGEAALEPPPTTVPVRQTLLWVVLVGGALLLVGMVLRLLRAAPRGDDAG